MSQHASEYSRIFASRSLLCREHENTGAFDCQTIDGYALADVLEQAGLAQRTGAPRDLLPPTADSTIDAQPPDLSGETPAVASGVLIEDPQWRRQPSGRDFARLYPERAMQRGDGGRVVLDCLVVPSGDLRCTVVEEDPIGQDFGDAALRLSRLFEIERQQSDGSASAGRRVRLPIVFRVEE